MELNQRLELKHLLAPQLRQSLKILSLPILDLQELINEEMLSNPVLEEAYENPSIEKMLDALPSSLPAEAEKSNYTETNIADDQEQKDYAQQMVTKKVSLQDILLKQLGITANTNEELNIGHQIIGNIDENGYLRASLEDIAASLDISTSKVEPVLKLIQKFDPAGVGARSIPECLMIQLELAKESDQLLIDLVKYHLEDIATKNFSKIAKNLQISAEKVENLVQIIAKLNPKPGMNYSVDEIQKIVPDVIIEETEDGQLKVTINNDRIPRMVISRTYRQMLKKENLDAQTKEFLTDKVRRAYELLKSVSRRQSTLHKVIEIIVDIQNEAIRKDISLLKPLNFKEIAQRINMHESTVCRVIMNKYAQTPIGIIALKEFFPSKLTHKDANGQDVSSEFVKGLIQEFIGEEDKNKPLSDEDIVKLLKEKNNLDVARRTVAKYREELKILSSPYRRNKN